MRTRVAAPTDHVVVVGAGLGGLSAALRLAGAGRAVTVLERADVPGGRAGVLRDGEHVFDTGPTVLTMPDLIADALDCVGESLSDWLELAPVRPLYRARFADGSALDVHAEVDAMAESVYAMCGPREAAGYRRFADYVTRLYRLEMRDFIDRNIDAPLGLLRPSLARLVAMGGFRRLAPKVATFLHDERLQRVFSFQAMYAGLSPYDALAIYAVIDYMDSVAGVFYPRGGMHAVPLALAGAAEKHGVVFRYGEEVTRVEVSGDRAVAVHTAGGERVPCDAVVLNPDLPVARRELLGRPLRRRLRYSPSCFQLLAGLRTAYPHQAHHTISFGHAWREVFDDVLGGRLMRDPSFLVTAPPAADGSPGRSACALFPTPNLDAPIDWEVEAPRYRDQVVSTLESRGWPGFGERVEVEHVTTPLDWAERGMERGTPFAASHSFTQTGPFRPDNRWGQNVVFAGSGTRPGVGVPMVLISGRLAAERITGPDPAYRSRAYP
ncbi:MAG: phytoene desaturase [Actinomycetota bacterium]|nr:phytoene desaturase [Actinomycetota bacterium]